MIPVFCFTIDIKLFYVDNKTGLVEETCGIDNSKQEEVQEGASFIETYPWFGVIVFPLGEFCYFIEKS